uniref:GPI inositol-deacylase n=1 Tax=Ananas comosus var. bracteatus TaxID=296719 RepID=A0A6V7QCN6_ANACO|nr:unnamed protein product [Ananas comosus var. bracteatus]
MSSLFNLTSSPVPIPIPIPTTSPPRPVAILPGLGNNRGDYGALAAALREKHGVAAAVVAEVSRIDWLRNAAGLLDPNYWSGTLRPRPVLDWYLERVDRAVAQAKSLASPGQGISLIGHSAGGWLARVYMEEFGFDGIALLLTLGSPHSYAFPLISCVVPPPKNVPGVIDQTRGLLDYVEKNCAPAVYTPELRYVCIAGRYIQGARLIGNSKPASEETLEIGKDSGQGESIVNGRNNKPAPSAPTLRARFVGQGYKQVCGRADVWGDGVVPKCRRI